MSLRKFFVAAPDPETEYDPHFLALREAEQRCMRKPVQVEQNTCADLWGFPTEPAPVVVSEVGMVASRAMVATLVCVIAMAGLWGFIELGKIADTQEAETQRNVQRLRDLGVDIDNPITVATPPAIPDTYLSRSFGVTIGEEKGR